MVHFQEADQALPVQLMVHFQEEASDLNTNVFQTKPSRAAYGSFSGGK